MFAATRKRTTIELAEEAYDGITIEEEAPESDAPSIMIHQGDGRVEFSTDCLCEVVMACLDVMTKDRADQIKGLTDLMIQEVAQVEDNERQMAAFTAVIREQEIAHQAEKEGN